MALSVGDSSAPPPVGRKEIKYYICREIDLIERNVGRCIFNEEKSKC